MYSQEDINSAVAAGTLTKEAADALRAHVEGANSAPQIDEENFRLVTSFNDIFVTIGIVIMLVAVSAIASEIAGFFAPDPVLNRVNSDQDGMERYSWFIGMSALLAGTMVGATAWGLAEFFTRKRRMALPSIVLLLQFSGSVFGGLAGVGMAIFSVTQESASGYFLIAVVGLLTVGAVYLHWRRFAVPITVAAGVCCLCITGISLLISMLMGAGYKDNIGDTILTLVFIAGLAVFAFAMRWDMSDPRRETRRSDVAFWLHLLSAPMIAHPMFNLLGVIGDDQLTAAGAGLVVIIYILFGIIALAIDRRALLVSALAYVLIALAWLFDTYGAVGLTFALTALVIGSALLTLSAFWTPIRGKIISKLSEGLAAKLPPAASA